MRYICPRCGGEGRPSFLMWLEGPFRYIVVRGWFIRKYFLPCVCDACMKKNLFKAHFDVELTKKQALDFERAQKMKFITLVGRVEP